MAIIGTVCNTFGRETLTDWRTLLIAVTSMMVTFGFRKVNTVWVVVGAGLLGYLFHLI